MHACACFALADRCIALLASASITQESGLEFKLVTIQPIHAADARGHVSSAIDVRRTAGGVKGNGV